MEKVRRKKGTVCFALFRTIQGARVDLLRATQGPEPSDRRRCGLRYWVVIAAHTTAQVAMMCVSRYENTGSVAYRDLVHAAADAYLKRCPHRGRRVADGFGHAISLQVAAWRSTAQQKYLDRARELADFAVKHFFDEGQLPRASLKSTHYDAVTGADTLALGLVELHLHILAITAVRYPPNTIDR
jgi:hypothetical protein